MKKCIPFLLLFLCACSKDPGRSGGSLGGNTFIPKSLPPQEQYTGTPLYYLLAGQSNMSGEACLPAYSQYPSVTMSGPFNYGTVGIGYAFGIFKSYETKTPVVLIQCSMGGTSINEWQPTSGLFINCMEYLKQNNIKVSGVLFAQSEKDAVNGPVEWASLFRTMVNGLRCQLNSPTLPVVFFQIGGWGNNPVPPYFDQIRAEQEKVMMTNVAMVRVEDIEPTGGGWHYAQREATELGYRALQAMNSMLCSML